jgi:uncharacterized protein YcbK (DUF882 family)
MSQTIRIAQQTYFKRSTKQAVELPACEKISVTRGQTFDVRWFRREGDHVLFELELPADGIFNWYAYTQHIQVFKDGSVQKLETFEESKEASIEPDNTQLSEHFKLWEFVTSQTAARHGINNTPPNAVADRLSILCQQILEPARQAVGPLRISSGYRCPALNKAVGGSKTSAHMQGYAADVIPLSASKLEFANWIKFNCKFDQIILEYGTPSNPSWIHVSCDPKGRRQFFRIP